jgi:hypothetical protein
MIDNRHFYPSPTDWSRKNSRLHRIRPSRRRRHHDSCGTTSLPPPAWHCGRHDGHILKEGSASNIGSCGCAAAIKQTLFQGRGAQGLSLPFAFVIYANSLLRLPHQRPGAPLRCAPRRLVRRRSAAGRHGSRRPSSRWQGPARPRPSDGCASLRAGRKAA